MFGLHKKQVVATSAGSAKATPSMAMNFATAGLGGIFGWMIVHPANTAAVQMNLATMSGNPPTGFVPFMRDLVRARGFMSLYDGLGAGMMKQVVYATSRIGLFEVMRDEYKLKYGSVDFLGRMGCGMLSGGIAAFISCPTEVTLVRLSNDSTLPVESRRNYTGVTNAFSRIMKEEGGAAFFRGAGPFVNRAMMVGAVQVGTNDQFKVFYKEKFGVTNEISNVFCAAMSSGLLYSIVTMPFETCKNRMAFQKPDPATGKLPFTGTAQAITKIMKTDGILALWNGFIPYYLRCGGHTVFMFMAIQQLRLMM